MRSKQILPDTEAVQAHHHVSTFVFLGPVGRMTMPLLRPLKNPRPGDLLVSFSPTPSKICRITLAELGLVAGSRLVTTEPYHYCCFSPSSYSGYDYKQTWASDYSFVTKSMLVNGTVNLYDQYECRAFLRRVVKRHRQFLSRLCNGVASLEKMGSML